MFLSLIQAMIFKMMNMKIFIFAKTVIPKKQKNIVIK